MPFHFILCFVSGYKKSNPTASHDQPGDKGYQLWDNARTNLLEGDLLFDSESSSAKSSTASTSSRLPLEDVEVEVEVEEEPEVENDSVGDDSDMDIDSLIEQLEEEQPETIQPPGHANDRVPTTVTTHPRPAKKTLPPGTHNGGQTFTPSGGKHGKSIQATAEQEKQHRRQREEEDDHNDPDYRNKRIRKNTKPKEGNKRSHKNTKHAPGNTAVQRPGAKHGKTPLPKKPE